ncbi:MAG: phosphopantetheine-binding protein [Pseudomonadota bacterium]
MKALLEELKVKIVEVLGLFDITPEEIADDAPFFQGGLGLDSVDILELVVMVETEYGIRIDTRELGEKIFVNLASLAEFIQEHRR